MPADTDVLNDPGRCVRVDTFARAEAAVKRFLEQKEDAFALEAPKSLYKALRTDGGLRAILARQGVADCVFRVMDSRGLCLISDMVAFQLPWAVVKDGKDAVSRLTAWRKQRITRFVLVFADWGVFSAMEDEDWAQITFLAGMEMYSAARNLSSGAMRFTGVEWSDTPKEYCESEDDLVRVFRDMGRYGYRAADIRLSASLWRNVSPNDFGRLRALEAKGFMADRQLRYSSERRILYYANAVIHAGAGTLDTLEAVKDYMAACAERGDENVTLFLTDEVYRTLTARVPAFMDAADVRIHDLANNNGLIKYKYGQDKNARTITYSGIRYYPGLNIVRALRKGSQADLTVREKETLRAAERMVRQCRSGSGPETLRRLHDELCRTVTYTVDPNTDEDDCAVGALLNGEANCDGYADALYLTGTIAGLTMRYQHGDSRKADKSSGDGSMHMWNLVRFDGTWRLVDATWDDTDSGDPVYAWFNIGEDRAKRAHRWNPEMTVPLDRTTDPGTRPVREYAVSTLGQIREAAARARREGIGTYELLLPADTRLSQKDIMDAAAEGRQGLFSGVWLPEMKNMSVRG